MKKIKDVSIMAGVTKRTLQFYDDEGILPAKRSETNERLYTEEDIERLWKILVYKNMGLKLNKIREILAENQEDAKKLLEEHIEYLSNEKEVIEDKIRIAETILQSGIPKVDFKKDKD